MNWLRNHWQNNKTIWLQIIVIFIITRILLSTISYATKNVYIPIAGHRDWKTETLEVKHPILNKWAVWDSKWYMKIVETGYSDSNPLNIHYYATIGFFPLYPLLVSIFGFLIGDYLITGLILSNLFLIFSAFLLYKLIKIDSNEDSSKKAIFYLFLFPSAYILSAFYPESLVLFLWLGSILLARKNIWWAAGLLGFFSAFAKPQGFLIFIPLLLIFVFENKTIKEIFEEFWPINKIKASLNKILFDYILKPKILFSLFPILGLSLWCVFNKIITGDFLAFSHIQNTAWHHHLSIPFVTIYNSFFYGTDYVLNSLAIIIALIIILISYKKVSFAYWFFGLVLVLLSSINGEVSSSIRYMATIFPLIIILTSWSKTETADRIIILILSLLQGSLFVFWNMGYWFTA